jgi:Na+-driven multidrug efflux pump
MVVGPALAWTLSSVFEMGPTGVWLGLAIAWVMQAIMVAWIFKLGKWKQIEL